MRCEVCLNEVRPTSYMGDNVCPYCATLNAGSFSIEQQANIEKYQAAATDTHELSHVDRIKLEISNMATSGCIGMGGIGDIASFVKEVYRSLAMDKKLGDGCGGCKYSVVRKDLKWVCIVKNMNVTRSVEEGRICRRCPLLWRFNDEENNTWREAVKECPQSTPPSKREDSTRNYRR